MRLIVAAVTQRTRSRAPTAHEYRPERVSPRRFAQVRGGGEGTLVSHSHAGPLPRSHH